VLLAVPGANGYGVWLVTAKGLEWRPPQDAPLAAIAHQLAAMQPDRALALRGQVGAQAPSTSSTATRFDESEAERLGNWLLAGFGPRLSNVRQLATVVSGPLAQLPFATLRWNGRWLVDRMMLVRLPAVASLPETIAAPLIAAERGVIALGAVSGTDLPELPGARRQLEDIGALFGGDATIRQGVEATRGWLQGDRRLTQAGVLVFATHSRRSAEPARELALQLAPDPALPGDDGLLSLAQIGELRLTAPLVILTACDTATATPADADPLASFSRAFFLAGAQALLVSHWALDDAAAREQMRRFFEVVRAKPGIAPAEAFRRSALALRDDRSGRWRHPRYWAALSYVEGGTMGSAATVPGASGGKRTVTASPPPARSAN
jgi:CHAT domain-containing protein